jgi:hypothetical protein
MEDVVEKRLVEPDRAQAACAVADEHFKDSKPRTTSRTDSAAEDFAGNGCGNPGSQRRDGLKMPAILVTCGKPIEEILDGREADVLQIGGAARADAFEVLEGTLEGVHVNVKCSIER